MCKAIKHKSIVKYIYKLGTRTMSVVEFHKSRQILSIFINSRNKTGKKQNTNPVLLGI